MNVVSLLGSPSLWSRSAWLLERVQQQLERAGARSTRTLALRELPPAALLRAELHDPVIREAVDLVQQADVVLIATPIYKAAYSGLLKAFLDLLPQDGLRGKTVLALGTGGSPGHLLAIDYALKPVLHALGARHIADAVFAAEAQLEPHVTRGYVAEDALLRRLDRAVQSIFDSPAWQAPAARRIPEPAVALFASAPALAAQH
jgi:FMN reductase